MKNGTFRVKITDNYGKGWFFTITNSTNTGHTQSIRYRTDKMGEGLFKMLDDGTEKQQIGTCQFKLSTNKQTARKQIREYFKMYLGYY